YQGSLKDGGSPANGLYDFTFKLFDALAGGGQVGSTVSIGSQTVSQGLFTVQLDFGASVFQGSARWLEVAVRPAGGGTYTTLSPRQALTAAPYAASLMPGASVNGTQSGPVLSVTNSTGSAVQGTSTSGDGGYFASSSTTGGSGVRGSSSGLNGTGLFGTANSGTQARGVYGQSSTGAGVVGESSASGSSARAVYGLATGSNAVGVYGAAHNGLSAVGVRGDSFTGIGVYGGSTSDNGYGVFGINTSSSGFGVYGQADALIARGVMGSSTGGYGVYGYTSTGIAVFGEGSTTGDGVWGLANCAGCYGVFGYSTAGQAVRGESSTGWAGYFQGNVNVTGTCCGAGQLTTKIDHPIDPENKYLVQSVVQSPDLKSVYDGSVTLNSKGEAVVTLPDYVQALNTDFRYQLTAVGAPGPNLYIAEKLTGNRFKIAGGKPGMEVSWQVTGTRIDPYAKAHPIQSEVDKPADDQGKYRHPAEWGQPESKGTNYKDLQKVRRNSQPVEMPEPAAVK
ncbi:MAG TPA: hypothetical protein VFR15_19715, partial [Chloroflexia bacterium]|nr:hypothetical protein [Chloroflexia bacterium]